MRVWAGLIKNQTRGRTTLTMAQSSISPLLAVRGSGGISLLTQEGTSLKPSEGRGLISSSRECRVLAFSPDGSQLAWCDGKSVEVADIEAGEVKFSIPKPKTRHLQFSPFGTYLALWEPYAVTKDAPSGTPNLEVWARGEKVADFTQKKHYGWCPHWSEDEQLCARNVTNEVHCFEGGQPSRSISCKLQMEGLMTFSLSPGKPPYKIAVYVPGSKEGNERLTSVPNSEEIQQQIQSPLFSHHTRSTNNSRRRQIDRSSRGLGQKGAPSFVRLYEYPRLEGPGAIVASKSFYRADNVKFLWNRKGSAVIVVTTTDTDKSGASYYGEQGLLYLSARGDGSMVPLSKKGPIYMAEWNPNSEEFCVIYGFMPSKATLFNCKCEPVHDFGTGHRNEAHFNLHGNTGFGNLRGNMEFWDRDHLKLLSKPQASDSTQFEWCPDGVHVVTATTAPRLREGNGFKVWHFSGSLVYQQDTPPRQELWEVKWRPFPLGTFPTPNTSAAPPPSSLAQAKPQAKPAAYRPPALRGKPSTSTDLHRDETSEGATAQELSKSALKNKRKREAKQRARQQEGESGRSQDQQDAVAMAAHLLGPASTGGSGEGTKGGGDREKQLRNLRKKLRQIEQLKQQQKEGKELQANQIEKINTEASLLEEISRLELED